MAVAAEAPERDPGASAAPSRARVLVVDDEPAMLRALRINLRVRKYDVATAATGQEALAEAGRRPPDAVILDLGLPDLDGIEVIRRLRGWSRAPVIVLSGRAGPGDKMLEILLRHPGQLVATQRLLTEIWGPGYERYTNYLRVHMSGLRRKLETDPSRPRHLLTEPGMGYRYQP
jgi:DNA-binding response OmpR family regulator